MRRFLILVIAISFLLMTLSIFSCGESGDSSMQAEGADTTENAVVEGQGQQPAETEDSEESDKDAVAEERPSEEETDTGADAGMAGKYVYKDNPEYYIELFSDHTFYLYEGIGSSGTWRVDGNTITLMSALFGSQGRVEGNTLIDEDGWVWVKTE